MGASEDLASMLAAARVLHLQPDDQFVIEMDQPLTEEMADRISAAFAGRRVVVFDKGITFATSGPSGDAQGGRAHGDVTAAQGSTQGDSGGKR